LATLCSQGRKKTDTFREYGLPDAIRSDNGSPFTSIVAGGISRLSKWWIQLGIQPQRIKPCHPQQNGRHERMHKSLKEATTKPSSYSQKKQQKQFDDFLHERSHEALGRKLPSEVYQPSTHQYPERLEEIIYDEGIQVRKVTRSGEIKWRNTHIYISQVLSGEYISLAEIDNDVWEVRYSFYKLGILRGKDMKPERATQWHKKSC